MISFNIQEFYQKHIDGCSISSLAKEIGMSVSGLNKVFTRNGMKIIKRNYPKKGIKIPELTKNKIDSLYARGNSISDISKMENICVSQVWRVLKEKKSNTQKTIFNYRHKSQKYKINEMYFSKIDCCEKAYILGFLFADGNAHSVHKHIKLKLQEIDRYILERICKFIGTDRPLYFHKKSRETHQNQYSFVISNKIIYSQLISHGIEPNKTFVTKFPYQSLTRDLYPSFVRGYFDGDGCLYYDKKRNVACWSIIGSTMFCRQISDLLSKELEIKSYIAHDHRAKVGIDILRIRKASDVIKICEWMYQNSSIHLDRKFEKFKLVKERLG